MKRRDGFYVVGGSQRNRFRAGLVLHVDPAGAVRKVVEYVSPPHVCPPRNPEILFKAGTLKGDRLYLCTQTEIVVFSVPGFRRVAYLSLPYFNDLHHVLPAPNGNLLVAVTGLDMVAEVTLAGDPVRKWKVLGEAVWDRFSRAIDYRRHHSTKPHRSHPNFLFLIDDDVWVTRYEQRDALCLTNSGGRMPIDVQHPHDGIVVEGQVYFTTIDGRIVVIDRADQRRRAVYDLNEMSGSKIPLGWCRGLCVMEPHKVVVGFSRLRSTRLAANLKWVKADISKLEDSALLPTRIACFNLKRGRIVWERELDSFGMNAVFSIHPAEEG